MRMNCPRCSAALVDEKYEDIPVDRCSSCHGIWLDSDEIGQILESREKKFNPELVRKTLREAKAGVAQGASSKPILCPICSKPMGLLNFSYSSGVIIDICSEHGLWFDQEELEQVQAFHEAWEAKKGDIKSEYRSTLNQVEKDYWESYDQMRVRDREKMFLKHMLFYTLDRVAHRIEKATRKPIATREE
jgi:Zn-finger nucleic acid-binding protein